MTPRTVWERLQSNSLAAAEFTHEAHVKAIWHLLGRHSLPVAARKFVLALKSFTRHLGAADKYHETITLFYVYQTASRMRGDQSWHAFRGTNPDLFEHAQLMHACYRPESLSSEFARGHYLPPDRPPLSMVSSTR